VEARPLQPLPKPTVEAKGRPTAAGSAPTSPLPSSASSKSTPTPSAVSPTNGGIRYLTVEEIVELHIAVDREVGGRNASPGVVESQFGLVRAVQVPQATFLGREAYAAFSDKAAVLFWGIVKDRPFKDGNRRVALVALSVFCELNGATIDAKLLDERKLEQMTKKAANHREDGVAPEAMFGEIRNVLRLAIRRPAQGK
jgi:death-on-curing protein